jgi:hypothetical protein
VSEAWARLLKDDNKTNWVLAGYEGGNTKEIVVREAEGFGVDAVAK